MTLKEIIETHRDLCGSVIAYAKEKLAGTDYENPKVINYEYTQGVLEYNIKCLFLDNGVVLFSYDDDDSDMSWFFDELPLGIQIDILTEL